MKKAQDGLSAARPRLRGDREGLKGGGGNKMFWVGSGTRLGIGYWIRSSAHRKMRNKDDLQVSWMPRLLNQTFGTNQMAV